jgi:hypothetical protein
MSARMPAPTAAAGRWIAIVAGIVVVATLVAAIMVMGSPARQRLMRLDERRVEDLSRIASAVEAYHLQHGSAPDSLEALAAGGGVRIPSDPATRQPYGFEKLGKAEVRLCAQFDTDTAESSEPQPWLGVRWLHGAGRQCFKRRSDTLVD